MRAPDLLRFAGHHPLRPTPWARLVLAAVLSLLLWQGVEAATGRLTHPAYPQMLRAAHTMQAATQVARSQRAALGLMAPRSFDPNETGLLGAEYTDTTTTLGDPAAKRTATNPDLAAALLRQLWALDLPPGSPVLVILSGSFIGADIAAIVAVEELGLRPVLVASLGASMHGATDAQLTWLDIEAELRAKGVIRARSRLALLGGGASIGGGMSEEGVATLRAAALRHGVPILEDASLARLLDRLLALAEGAGAGPPRAIVNAGGSVAALGECIDVALIAPVTRDRALSCQDGEPGLLVRLTAEGLPAISLLNMREVAAQWGLPFDPSPLPVVGNNRSVYGMRPAAGGVGG